jgi:hypothetical protein
MIWCSQLEKFGKGDLLQLQFKRLQNNRLIY